VPELGIALSSIESGLRLSDLMNQRRFAVVVTLDLEADAACRAGEWTKDLAFVMQDQPEI